MTRRRTARAVRRRGGRRELSAGLNLGATFTDVPGGTANWTFTGGTNYNDQNGTAAIVINKATRRDGHGLHGTYDAAAHGASGTATGVGGVNLSAGLNLGATFTDVPGGDGQLDVHGRHQLQRPERDRRNRHQQGERDGTVTVTRACMTRRRTARAARRPGWAASTWSAGLNLGATFTDVPGGTANWTFTGGTNYNDQSGTAAIVISKAERDVTVTGYTGVYDAAAHGASGTATGVGGVEPERRPEPRRDVHRRARRDGQLEFTGGTNYNDQSGTAAIVISKADATVTVNGYTGTYDAGRTARAGTATGCGWRRPERRPESRRDFTDVPGGTAQLDLHGRHELQRPERRPPRSSSTRRTRR